jgi:transposase-like protein
VQRYVPEFEKRWSRYARPVGGSWRVDETYLKIRGQWVYLYRAVDKAGRTVDFLLSRRRDMSAAKRFFSRAAKQHGAPRVITLDGYACLAQTNRDAEAARQKQTLPTPRLINTDKHAGYPPAIVQLQAEGALEENRRHRPGPYHK